MAIILIWSISLIWKIPRFLFEQLVFSSICGIIPKMEHLCKDKNVFPILPKLEALLQQQTEISIGFAAKKTRMHQEKYQKINCTK